MIAASTRLPPSRPPHDEVGAFISVLDRYHVDHVDSRRIDAEHKIPAEHLAELAGLGVFGVSIPEAHGGAELGLYGACRIIDALARRDRAIATTVGLHLGLGTRGLVAFGSDTQKARYLPALAAGENIAAFATTEPNAGSDLMRLETRATFPDGGDPTRYVRINGQKLYVTNGGLAGLFTITAATAGLSGAHDRALFLVDRDTPGVSVGPEEHKLGLRGSSTTPVFFDDVHLGPDQRLGAPGQGGAQLDHILAWGRTAMAAGCCGTAQSALDEAVAHVQRRRQFGRSLASQPVIRLQLADMAATLHTMRAMVRMTAAATGPTLERFSLSTKVFASDGDCAICDLALQLHGGSGYLEDTGLPLLLRDARITRIFEGANDVLITRRGQLELTSPDPSPHWDDPVSSLVAGLIEEARHRGLRALADPLLLHRLGRLVVLRDAADSLHDSHSPLAAHALHRLRSAAFATRLDLPPDTTEDALTALLEPEHLA